MGADKMDKYDLMLELYPEKKGMISRLRNLERKQLLEFVKKQKYNEEHHIFSASSRELDSLDICIPHDWYPGQSELIKSRIEASGLGAVRITEKYMEFDWFPYTLVGTQCDLCGEFVQRIIRMALEDRL